MIKEAIRRLVRGQSLDAAAMQDVMRGILSGAVLPSQIAAITVALRMKGETTEELSAAVQVLRDSCLRLVIPDELRAQPILDTCGTGGDGVGTFNVSTLSAIVVAAAGVRVAKHGNRAVSSRTGSADLLEALGVNIHVEPAMSVRCLHEVGITFLFAPMYHAAMRFAAPVRQELGIRTFFNLLGPLCNPAVPSHQLLGVYDPTRIAQMAEVLHVLGAERAWVVHGDGGLDEVSVSGPTQVAELHQGEVSLFQVSPEDFGMTRHPLAALAGGDAEENARIAQSVLRAESSAYRDAVVLNAAAALYVAQVASDYREARAQAERAIQSGAAMDLLQRWKSECLPTS